VTNFAHFADRPYLNKQIYVILDRE